MTVGILHDPWRSRRGGQLRRYRMMVDFKANPRDPDYMRALFAERYADGTLGRPEDVSGAARIVLLYPDAIGIGWSSVERAVARRAPEGVEVRVLNGRRRDFVLDRRSRRQLKIRGFLETGLLCEAVATAAFLALTPLLFGWDVVRGRV